MAIAIPCCRGSPYTQCSYCIPQRGLPTQMPHTLPLPVSRSSTQENLQTPAIHERSRPQTIDGAEGYSRLERLPPEIFDMIVMKLSYLDLLRLQRVNKVCCQTVDPQRAPEEDKIGLVMSAETYFERNHQKEGVVKRKDPDDGVAKDVRFMVGFGCYSCYRVLHLSEFAFEQYSTNLRGNLRRYCIRCGLKKGYYQPGDTLQQRNDARIWICGCKEIKYTATSISCDGCRMNMPMRKREGQCLMWQSS